MFPRLPSPPPHFPLSPYSPLFSSLLLLLPRLFLCLTSFIVLLQDSAASPSARPVCTLHRPPSCLLVCLIACSLCVCIFTEPFGCALLLKLPV